MSRDITFQLGPVIIWNVRSEKKNIAFIFAFDFAWCGLTISCTFNDSDVHGAPIPSSEVEFKEGRNLRLSLLHQHLQAAGAFFTPCMGWECVSYFKVNQGQGQPEVKDAFGQPSWLGCVEKEVRACQESVGLFDASSMVVLDIQVSKLIIVRLTVPIGFKIRTDSSSHVLFCFCTTVPGHH